MEVREPLCRPHITVQESIDRINPSKAGPNGGQSGLTTERIRTLSIVIAYILSVSFYLSSCINAYKNVIIDNRLMLFYRYYSKRVRGESY